MKDIPAFPTAADVKQCARDLGLTIPELCARAEVAPSTFYRWANDDFEINLAVARRLQAVLEDAAREREG